MQSISVLVLDDEEFMLDIMQTMLGNLGISAVSLFTSATLALPVLRENDPDQLVICDLNMPGMDGVEFLRYLAQREFAGGVILLSGEDARTLKMVESMACASKLRLLGSIQKPVERATLISLLDLMRSSKGSDRLPDFLLDEDVVRHGLADALVPFYQPQVDIHTGKLIGVEALARWHHAEYGIISPSAFIPVVDKIGLNAQLTYLMLGMALRQASIWRKQAIDLQVSVNISMDCLILIDLPDRIVSEARICDYPIDKLMLEITEGQLMQDLAVSLDVLSRLCLKRIQLSIDDFGTAYSNLEKLQMLPFAELKIDRSFVYGAANNTLKRSILETSAGLGKRLNMQIIAEGVESQEDWDCAAAAGCDIIQGYFVARPMPGNELEAWLRHWEQAPLKSGIVKR